MSPNWALIEASNGQTPLSQGWPTELNWCLRGTGISETKRLSCKMPLQLPQWSVQSESEGARVPSRLSMRLDVSTAPAIPRGRLSHLDCARLLKTTAQSI